MNKKKIIIVCIIILILFIFIFILLIPLMKLIDYKRVQSKKQPIFCFKREGYLDGGSVEWYGPGYKILDIYQLPNYKGVKVGGWDIKIDRFDSEIQEYKKNNQTITISILRINSKGELYEGININGNSDEGKQILETINSAQFDGNIFTGGNHIGIIIIATDNNNNVNSDIASDNYKKYDIYKSENQIYLINENNETYKLDNDNLNIISNIYKKILKYYGDSYKIKNYFIVFLCLIIIILTSRLIKTA